MRLQKETNPDSSLHGKWYNDACGTAFGMEILGERWSLLVVRELMFGPLRFSDIRASLPGISAKVLTERLDTLEQAGVLVRRKLPPPAAVQVYELTEWGRAAEPAIRELGHWAASSPLHNARLPLSPTSFMLSLRTMFDPAKAGEWQARIGFRFPQVSYVMVLADGMVPVTRAETEGCDVVFTAPEASPLAGMFYGDLPAEEVGVTVEGDAAIARRFMGLFALPDKLA